jgi:hypothetical protein
MFSQGWAAGVWYQKSQRQAIAQFRMTGLKRGLAALKRSSEGGIHVLSYPQSFSMILSYKCTHRFTPLDPVSLLSFREEIHGGKDGGGDLVLSAGSHSKMLLQLEGAHRSQMQVISVP